MDWNRIEGDWKRLKGNAKEQWGRLRTMTSPPLMGAASNSKASCRSVMATPRIASSARSTIGLRKSHDCAEGH